MLPGAYTVKLTVDGTSFTQPLTIRMDPRVKASAADLKVQFVIETKITAAMHRDFSGLTQVRSLRAQLNELQQSDNPNVKSAAADLDKKAAELEGVEGGYGAFFLSSPSGRGLVRLNEALNNLLGIADSADGAPTTQLVAMFDDVEKVLDEQLGRWAEIQKREIPALNIELKQAGVPQLEPKSAAGTEEPVNQ